MDSKSIKCGLFLITLTGACMMAGKEVHAEDAVRNQLQFPTVGVEALMGDSMMSDPMIKRNIVIGDYLIQGNKGEYLDMGFSNVEEDSFLYIRSEASKESEWLGKLYKDQAVVIKGPIDEWTRIESGSVTGYVKTEFLTVGYAAQGKAQEILKEKGEFSYAESKEEEKERLAKEAQIRAEEAKEAMSAAINSGAAVVDYARQFIGNPYVWGGTSLTNGADCSGFVQSVYANFGVSMPRTSKEMRNAGRAVSYSEAIPGDVICYEGHVGIYVGDGQIVNAIDEAHGIGISSATYTDIITVRRLI